MKGNNMRIFIIVGLLLASCSLVFALDTDLGKIPLTKNQISHLNDLKTENVKGFGYYHAEEKLVVVTLTPLSTNEIKQLIIDVNALPNTALPIVKTEEELLKERVTALETKMTNAETDITALKAK